MTGESCEINPLLDECDDHRNGLGANALQIDDRHISDWNSDEHYLYNSEDIICGPGRLRIMLDYEYEKAYVL